MRHTALYFALLMAGCTSIDMHKPAPLNCPIRQVNTYTVSPELMADVCSAYAPALMAPLACTLLYLNQGKAEIWITKDAPQWVIDHERLHAFECRDHIGSNDVEMWLSDFEKGIQPSTNGVILEKMDTYRKMPFKVEFLHDYKGL